MRTIFFFVVFISSIQFSAAQNSGAITASQQQGCAPLSIAFSTSLKQVIKYKWEFSNGVISTIDKPTILFEQPGSYDVKLFVEYADKKKEEFILPAFVTVNEVPVVNFTVNGEVFCDGDTVHFQNESVGASSYIWDFGDGTNSAEANPTHAIS
jgi:PKD repeat protein